MDLFKINDLIVFFLSLLIIELVFLAIITIKRGKVGNKNIRKIHIFIAVLILSLLGTIFFKIDWDFTGENKEAIITGKAFIFLFISTNIISIIITTTFSGIEKLIKKTGT